MKKILFLLLIGVLAVSLAITVISCKDETVEEVAKEETTTEEAPAEEEEDEGAIEKEVATEVEFNEPVEIFGMMWGPMQEVLEYETAEFQKMFPNITVNIEKQTPEDYFINIKAAYSSGEPPDFAQFQPGAQIDPFVQFLEPLAPWCEKEWGPNWQDNFYDSVNEQIEWSGKEYYMLPEGYTVTGLWANTDLLDEYNLSIPETLDDLLVMRDTLRSKDLAVFLCGFKTNWNAQDLFFFLLDEFAPGEFYKADMGEQSFVTPEIINALDMWKLFFDEELVQPGAYGLTTHNESLTAFFVEDKGAIVPIGAWNAPFCYGEYRFDGSQEGGFQPFSFPDLNGDGEHPRPTGAMSAGFGITKNMSDYKKAATFEFLKFFTTGEAAQRAANNISLFPATTLIQIEDSAYEVAGEYADKYKEAVEWYFNNTEVQGPRELRNSEIREGLYEVLSSVANGDKTPEEALTDLQEISEAIER